ncbi:MAG: HYR domain-containing protein [Candidatus Doudnabacteria bacterium]
MKKYTSFVLVVFSVVFVSMFARGASAFTGGDGSSGNPYQITNCVQLQEMNNNLTANYVLINDIDCSDTVNWNSGAGLAPIGTPASPFTGTFDGQEHKITGLFINRPSTNYVGLFGKNSGTIQNVGLVDVDITGNDYVGGLRGYNEGAITNSYATGRVSGRYYVGGLVGVNVGAITNSYATGRVSGGAYLGGLVGWSNVAITNSYATGNVTGGDYLGGLVGFNGGVGAITNSYAIGNVSGTNGNVGGLVGFNYAGAITNSYATGRVSGGAYVGGLVGWSYYYRGTITNSYWDTETSGQPTSAGGTGKTTAGMKQQSTFVGWDFATIWAIKEGVSYPYFSWQIPPVVDSDGDGYSSAVDCNDNNPNIHPGATEVCDGVDNDCDGAIDEGLVGPYTPNQMGVCAGSNMSCAGVNGWVVTYPSNYEPTEVSCDGKDNDCDGTIDEFCDTTPPVAPDAPDLQAASDTGSSDTDNITNDNTPSFDITGLESNSTVTVYDGSNILGTMVIPGGYTFGTFTPASPMNEGIYVITATQTDAAGNVGPISPAMVPNLLIDTTPPVIAAHADVTVEATSPAGAVVTYELPTATDNYDTNVVVTCTPVSGSTFPLGDTTVTCTATDLAGNNTILATRTVHVNVTVEAACSAGAVVTYELPTATDNNGASVIMTCTFPPGSTFPLGDTTVTCTATDSSGIVISTTFVVHVVDSTPPVITAHADVTVEAISAAGAVVTYELPTATDNYDANVAVTCTPVSGSIFPLGDTTVTCNAHDNAGNVAIPTTFKVSVQDKTAPTITIITPVSYGLYTVGTALDFSATDDQSGIASVVGNLKNTLDVSKQVASGDVPEPGVYTLVVTATDNAGNIKVSDTVNFVVYDPSGGFAIGGGWFYPDDSEGSLSSAGKANFGFNAKYKDSSSTGNLEFQYKSGPDINLKSTTIDWLVISETSAQFQGTGTINGTGLYTFRVMAKDNAEPGIGADHFDIRIWGGTDTSAGIVYKAKNTLSGGNIVVHKK